MAYPSLPSSFVDSSTYVEPDAFTAAFNTFAAEVKHRIFKLERLQRYFEDNESWRQFQSGNYEESVELLRSMRADEAQFDIEFFRRGLQFLRLRAVEFPISSYLEWEFQSYLLSVQYGETILITDMTNTDRSGPLWRARDFLLFDSFGLLVHNYNPEGVLRGGWVCEDQTFIKQYSSLAEHFLSQSVPLAVFMTTHNDAIPIWGRKGYLP